MVRPREDRQSQRKSIFRGTIGGRKDFRLRTIDPSYGEIYGTKYSSLSLQKLAGCGFVRDQRRAGVLEKFGTDGRRAGGPHAMPVKVIDAKAVPVHDTSEYVATLKSRDSAVIMPQVEGMITQIFVHSGDKVGAGLR